MMTYPFLQYYEIADDEDSMQQNVPQWQFYFSSHTLRPVFLTLPHDVSLCLVKYFLLKTKNWQIIFLSVLSILMSMIFSVPYWNL